MPSPTTEHSQASPPPEQLHFSLLGDAAGAPPLRLLEPIVSLQLTPFAAKAARATGATTVGELASAVFDPSKDYRFLGQGHLEEIRRKIEEFIGVPPFQKELMIDLPSLVRLSLADLDPCDRALIAMRLNLQQLVPLTPQESREALIALEIDKGRKALQVLDRARHKNSKKVCSFMELIFHGFVQPWMVQREGIAHEREITSFLFETSSFRLHPSKNDDRYGESQQRDNFRNFEKSLQLLQLLTGSDFLFANFLLPLSPKIWVLTPRDQERSRRVINDATMLMGNSQQPAILRSLAKAIEACRFEQWESCRRETIERLLFWTFADDN